MDLRGFNDAINGFLDDGWSLLSSDGGEDVTVAINSSPNKFLGSQYNWSMLPAFGGVLCAKASMLLQVFTFILTWMIVVFFVITFALSSPLPVPHE